MTLAGRRPAWGWLGEELPEPEQADRTPFAPRCLKDLVEERLFANRRDLFSRLDLVFIGLEQPYRAVALLEGPDTTSLDFEGAGGESLGADPNRDDRVNPRRGHELDHSSAEEWSGRGGTRRTIAPI